MTTDDLLVVALGDQLETDSFIRENVAPQLKAIFDCFIASGDVDGAMDKANKIRDVRKLTAEGNFDAAIDIMVGEGMPRGYAQTIISMISGAANAATTASYPA